MSSTGCQGSSRKSTIPEGSTPPSAIAHQRNLKPNSPNRRLSLERCAGPVPGVHSTRRSPYRPAASEKAAHKRPDRRPHSINSLKKVKKLLHNGRQPQKRLSLTKQ